MFLAIDIGNTTIALGIVHRQKVQKIHRIDTDIKNELLKVRLRQFLKHLKNKHPSLRKVVVCSVVPQALRLLGPILRKNFPGGVTVVGQDIKVPMVNRYRNPREVGQDRLVCAYAAKVIYGAPSVVIDLGTAITMDVISSHGEYWGGVIVPGLRLSAESLYRKTALLPKIRIKGPRSIIGKNTEQSILSGLFFGYGALLRGMIELITRQIKVRPHVIITGGHALVMRKYIAQKNCFIDKYLVFKGLTLLKDMLND